jgi:hemerythrin superfamily protein
MELKVPHPLKVEHDELHADLAAVTKLTGKIGDAARAVAKVLHSHFLKEEEYALPPLGLLADIASGKISADMKSVISMTDRLKAELPEMLKEHKEIVAALGKLMDVGRSEGKMEYVRFSEKLMLHAQTEEEVMYPTTILIGEYLKFRLNK